MGVREEAVVACWILTLQLYLELISPIYRFNQIKHFLQFHGYLYSLHSLVLIKSTIQKQQNPFFLLQY